MKLDLWSISSLVFYAALLLKVIRWLIRYPRKMRTVAPITAELTRDPARFFSVLILALGISFGALLLLSVNSQPSPPSRALSLLASGVAVLTWLGVLLLVFLVPAYNFTMNLKDGYHGLEKKLETLVLKNQRLEEKVGVLEAQIQTVSVAKQLPIQRKPAFRKKQPPRKLGVSSHQDANSRKQTKKDVGD